MNAPAIPCLDMAADEITAALAALEPELARLDLLIHREILRLRTRYELSLDEFRGLYISDKQVDALVMGARRKDGLPDPAGLTTEAFALLERIAHSPAGRSETPWYRLAASLGLSRAQRDIVLMALAPELDPKYEVLVAYLNNDVTRKLPTIELAGRLFADTFESRVELRGLLSPDALLNRLGVVEFAAQSRELPRAQRGLRLAPPLGNWLMGLPYADERLASACTTQPCTPSFEVANPPPPGLAHLARRIVAGEQLPTILCTAENAASASAAGHALFAGAARQTVYLDLQRMAAGANTQELVAALTLLARLQRPGIVATPAGALFDPEGRPLEAPLAALRQLCADVPGLVIAGTLKHNLRSALGTSIRCLEIQLPAPGMGERAECWRCALGPYANDADIDGLADRFIFDADCIMRAVQVARDFAENDGRDAPVDADLFKAARVVSGSHAANESYQAAMCTGWNDLVLPLHVQERLDSLLGAIRQRPRVLDEWGFGRRMSGARGIKALFAGPSGTGKTMAAHMLARRLGLDLQRIDLAAVVSKYIGETEKNLDRAFDTTRRTNAILFIDEADALFGKRSEVKDAHDRYANVETAYLLQKMEDHDGVVILATNLAGNIDDAFSRRVHFTIEFPFPDAAGRARLWRGMLPAAAPLSADIDYEFLGARFELAGGDIRNVVMDAAYAAATRDDAIDMGHLLRAVARQYAKQGKVPGAAEFRGYQHLLAEPPARRTGANAPTT